MTGQAELAYQNDFVALDIDGQNTDDLART
jgi:hypothetical protein